MRKILICLLVVLLIAVGVQAQEGYYPKEHIVCLHAPKAGEAIIRLRVSHRSAEALLTATVPLQEGFNDLPLCNILWTSRELLVKGIKNTADANRIFHKLLALYEQEGWLFDEEGASFHIAEPAMLARSSLWQEDAVLSLEMDGEILFSCKLFELEQLNDHQPVNQAEYFGIATGVGGCNLRSGPSTEYEKVGTLQKNESHPVIGKEGTWFKLKHPEFENCWVSQNLVTFVPSKSLSDAYDLFQKGDIQQAQAILENFRYFWIADEYFYYQNYLHAEKMNQSGDYMQALEIYKALGDRFGAAQKAELLHGAQPLPQSGPVMESEGDCEIVFTAPKEAGAYTFLVDKETGEKAGALFVRAGESATAQLPEGDYFLFYAKGNIWCGEGKVFGDRGQYAVLDNPLSLKSGQRARIFLSPEEGGDKGFTILNSQDFVCQGEGKK